MLIFSSLLLNRVVYFGDDSTELIQLSSILDAVVFDRYPSPEKDSLVLINSSYDNQLVKHYDDLTGSGNRTITDRNKLLMLFTLLNKNNIKYKYLVCDISFKDETAIDVALAHEMEKMKIVIPYTLDENKKLISPNDKFKNVNMGISQYETSESLFIKFRFSFGGGKTIPVIMYEDIHNKKYSFKNGKYKLDGVSVLNNSVLNFRIRHYDVFEKRKYSIVNLGNLLQLPAPIINKYLSNKMIIIGDFVSNDMHETVVGKMSGPLLLLNAYYALEHGDNIISWGFWLLLIFGFFILSFAIFLPPKVINIMVFSKEKEKINHFIITKILTNILSLSFISVCSHLFFGIHLNILYLIFYMFVLQYLTRKVYGFFPELVEKKSGL